MKEIVEKKISEFVLDDTVSLPCLQFPNVRNSISRDASSVALFQGGSSKLRANGA